MYAVVAKKRKISKPTMDQPSTEENNIGMFFRVNQNYFKTLIIKLAPNCYVLYLVTHHIPWDQLELPHFLISDPRVLFFKLSVIQWSRYMRPKVTEHKCAGIIRMLVLFHGGPYMRKYGIYLNRQYSYRLSVKKLHQ